VAIANAGEQANMVGRLAMFGTYTPVVFTGLRLPDPVKKTAFRQHRQHRCRRAEHPPAFGSGIELVGQPMFF
jgi:hypothetical protein